MITVYCENFLKHTNILRGQSAALVILNFVVHIATTFVVILLLFLLPSSFYQPLFTCFLHFFYCKFPFLIVPFIFKCFCLPSSFSISCCLVSLIILLMLSHFSLILLSMLDCVGLDMYREWKKAEFPKGYYIYEFGNNKIER